MKKKKKKDGGWCLTPKACLSIALNETSISDVDLFVEDDRHLKFESAYIILEQRMNKAGYITDKDGNTKYTFDAKIMINLQLDKKNIKNK